MASVYEVAVINAKLDPFGQKIADLIWKELKAAIASRLDAHAEDIVFSLLFGLVKIRVKDVRSFIEGLFD